MGWSGMHQRVVLNHDVSRSAGPDRLTASRIHATATVALQLTRSSPPPLGHMAGTGVDPLHPGQHCVHIPLADSTRRLGSARNRIVDVRWCPLIAVHTPYLRAGDRAVHGQSRRDIHGAVPP